MPFAKVNQECQSFLDSFIAGLFLRRIANPFGATCFYFLNIKAWSNKAIHIKIIGAKRQVSGMSCELKSSHSFLKTT
jgi:hypothetical protein